MSSDELPTPEGLNVFGAELVGRIFDPFGVRNSICWRVPIRGFHPRLEFVHLRGHSVTNGSIVFPLHRRLILYTHRRGRFRMRIVALSS